MKLQAIIFLLILIFFSRYSYAANQGKITAMYFSGSESAWGTTHNNIVQLEIEGGYIAQDCDPRFAAVRKSEQHLISAILSAYMAGKAIFVELNNGATYWDGSRCIIRDIIIKQ